MREVHAIGSVLDVVFLRHDRNFELCISAPPLTRHRSKDRQMFPTRQKNLGGCGGGALRGRPQPSVDHLHRGLHGAGAEPVQGLLAGLSVPKRIR
jgi:hypothetical protein